jgi:hypothetical protein
VACPNDAAIAVEVCFEHFCLPGVDRAADVGANWPVRGFQIDLVDKSVDRTPIKDASNNTRVVDHQEWQSAGVGETRLDVIPLSGQGNRAREQPTLQSTGVNLDLGIAQDYRTAAPPHEANDFV